MITVVVLERQKLAKPEGYLVTLQRPGGGSKFMKVISEAEAAKYVVGAQVKIPTLQTSK